MKQLIFIFLFLFSWQVQAQQPISHKAVVLYNQAQEQLRLRNYADAEISFENAILADPLYEDAYSALGGWYYRRHQYRQAAIVYRRLFERLPKLKQNYALLAASSFLYSGDVSSANELISIFAANKKEWIKLRNQANFTRTAMMYSGVSTIHNMGPRVNTGYAELFPSLSADGNTFFYTRNTNGIDQDFYFALPDTCGDWFAGKPFPYPINTLQQEAAQMVSADRHYLFFMRCDNRSVNGWDMGGCDLYMSYTADSIWSVPLSFGATINTPGYEGMPCLSSDNRVLYFVSNRSGGYGGMDIWCSRFENGFWQAPANLGPIVNTAGNETAPFLYPDNETLFFASDGHPGMGGLDLFMCKKTNDTSWTTPQNLGYPVNTGYNETSLSLTADGKHLFFASDREKPDGDYDLYEGQLSSGFMPKIMSYINCYVYDSLTHIPLAYSSCKILDEGGKELYHYTSNKGDGSFMVAIPLETTWLINTDRVGYQERTDTLSVDTSLAGRYCRHNIALLPDGYLAPIADTNVLSVYFPLNKFLIKDSAKEEIARKMSYWKEQPKLHITVNGYTDNSGTPIINEEYSYKRADIVKNELVALGFLYEQIEVKGWAEANPVTDNETEEHRDRNRRVEVVIRR